MSTAKPRIYLDHNIFVRAHECGENDTLLRFAKDRAIVLASEVHLKEAMDIGDAALRNQRLDVLQELSREIQPPICCLTSWEFVKELEHHHPELVKKPYRTVALEAERAAHRKDWALLQSGRSALEHRLGMSRQLWNVTEMLAVAGQKETRKRAIAGVNVGDKMRIGEGDLITLPRPYDGHVFEDRWRIQMLSWWGHALCTDTILGRPSRRVAGPMLRPIALQQLIEFLLAEARPENMPRSVCRTLASGAMLEKKIPRQGNSSDVNHATYLLDAEYFATTDRNFHDAICSLRDARPEWPIACPLYLSRDEPTIIRQLEAMLANSGRR